ncbi:MAG: DUF885 domain-containing protein [Acidimicrobiales bacterium]
MASVTEVSDRFIDDYAALDPEHAARMMGVGMNSPDVRDYSPEGNEALRQLFARVAEALDTATVSDEAERLGRMFLSGFVRGELGVHEAGEPEREVSVIGSAPSVLRLSFDLVAPGGDEDWSAIATRMEKVPAAMAGYRASLQRGLDENRPGSRRCAVGVADQCEVWSGAGRAGWFSTWAADQGDVHDAARLRQAAAAADQSYGELATWLRSGYIPRATDVDGVGRERYVAWNKRYLGIALDTDEAYEWGWEELTRLEAAQAEECERIQSGATFAEVRQLLNSDPARAIDGIDAWRGWLQDLTDRAIDELDGTHFDIAAPLRTCVVSIPPEGSAAAPYYTPPSDDLAEPGRIWFPPLGRRTFPTWDAVSTVFHEAVPGHHLQIGAVRMAPLTRAHRCGFSSAHGEGWALYAERLMDELGKFERPEYRLGFLSMQAFRAARVVIDIGLHTQRTIPSGRPHAGERWNYDLAVEYLEEASGLTPAFCQSEVLRYLAWPSQATSYKLGERVWLEGRRRASERQGARFDLKQWHGRTLVLGALGLADFGAELDRLAG